MAHIFYINDLEKLNFKKDSTLMMALTLSEKEECYLLFEQDLYISNEKNNKYKLRSFKGDFSGFYLNSFEITDIKTRELTSADTLYMRIDPPYDARYQRYLWMLDFLQNQIGLTVVNNPLGIMKHNEKLLAFKNQNYSISSYVGSTLESFLTYTKGLKDQGYTYLILKPLDLYSGIGVEKVGINASDLESIFERKVKEFQGAIVCQPFIKEISEGEIRAVFYKDKELGSIIKVPQKGEYLANIAQGASFEPITLNDELKAECVRICEELLEDGIELTAFDIMNGKINEINITCPGLLVEVSHAWKKNLCRDLFNI